MPAVPDPTEQLLSDKVKGLAELEGAGPDAEELAMATFRTENSIGSLIARSHVSGLPDSKVENADFNPWQHFTDEEKLDSSFIDNAAMADTVDELEQVRILTSRERKDRATIADGGAMSMVLGLGIGGLADPINLIPVGGAALKTYKTGSSILRSGMITGSVATASTAIQETALHATQLERTFGESAVNMSAAFLLGGALGMSGSALKGVGVNQKVLDEIDDSMNVETKIRDGNDSVGAARVDVDVNIEGKAAQTFAKVAPFDPLTRTLSSESPASRKAANALAENPYKMDTNTGASVETMSKIWDGRYTVALEGHRADFKSLREEMGNNSLKDRLLRKGVSLTEFNEMIGKYIRNPDVNAPAQVKTAAGRWQKELYEPLKNEAIAAKLLPEDIKPKTAVNYLNRVWSKDKISAKMPEFIQTVSKWLKREDVKLSGKSIDDEEYEFVAQEIAQRISGTPDGRLPYDWKLGEGSKGFGSSGTKMKGPLQERTFNIPDKLIEDFVENDIELLAGRYYKQLAPDIELSKAFNGDVGMEAQIKEVQDWWTKKIEKEPDAKKRVKLQKKLDADVRDLAGMRDRIRGVYGQADFDNIFTRIGNTVRDLNYLRFMGGVVASSVPDLARIFMAEGFAKTFKDGVLPLIKNAKSFKIAADEGKRYNGALSAMFGGRGEIIADVADYTKGGTKFERAVRGAAEKFGKVNMMDYWTAGVKQLQAVTMQTSVFDGLSKGKYDKRLGRLGITKDDADNMWKQVKKHGRKVDGVWVTGAKNWDSPALETMWGAAMRKESDRVIVVPGQEKPLFMSRDMGKTFMQFKSFMFSSTQKVLIAGLQGQDHNFVGGMTAITTLGMMAYAFKQWDGGRPLSDDPKVWLTEGIDRSGSLGMLMEVNNTLEKISANNYGLRPLIGASAPASRYASRSNYEAMLGPTFGSFTETTMSVLTAGTSERPWTKSDTRAMRRLLPYQNLSILRQAFDKIEGR